MGDLIIVEPGLLTTIQDGGRWGYQQYGVAVAGAMDHFSMEVANKLLGNPGQGPLLEMTLSGASFQVTEETYMAITGADMGARIDGNDIPMWETFLLKPGQTLSFSLAKKGIRTYLALGGSFDLDPILGSLSTYLPGKMGGFKGRKLEKGDVISLKNLDKDLEMRGFPESLRPTYSPGEEIRVVLGPQDDYFTDQGKEDFLSSDYSLTDKVDRMGYRLKGAKVAHLDKADIISDGILFGSVQVSGDGQPTIMMADHQTTGGYTKIATVISPDLCKLAQMKPGDKIRFKEVSPDQAQGIYKSWRRDLDKIQETFIDTGRKDVEMDNIGVESIGKIMDYFASSEVNEMVFEYGDFHLELKKNSKAGESKTSRPGKKKDDFPVQVKNPVVEVDENIAQVKAPVDGVCYRAPGEGEEPFVEVGQRVAQGDTLLIIEVMKMMNEIKAPRDGVIKSIDFENEERVEAGKVILTIE